MAKSFHDIRKTLLVICAIGGIFFFLAVTSTPTLSDDVLDSWPLPPGKNGKLTKEVCGRCHNPLLQIIREGRSGYTIEEARGLYENMVGDPDSEEGKKVIEYLTTVMGVKYD